MMQTPVELASLSIISKETKITVVNQTATILDLDQFENFLSNAISSNALKIVVAGSTVAFLEVFKALLKFNRTIQLAGDNI